MSVPIQPLAEYVVAQEEQPETKTASGLYLPDKAAEKPKVAKVLADAGALWRKWGADLVEQVRRAVKPAPATRAVHHHRPMNGGR